MTELSIQIPPDSDSPDSNQYLSLSQPNSGPSSSRDVITYSPFEQSILTTFSTFSLKSPHHFQSSVAMAQGTVMPIARAPMHSVMNRISEVPEPDANSCDELAINLNTMSADDEALAAATNMKSSIVVSVRASSALNNYHYTDGGSEIDTDVEEGGSNDEPAELDDSDANVVLENNNMVRIVHGPSAQSTLPLASQSMFNPQQSAHALPQPPRPASVSFPHLGGNSGRSENNVVTFATTNEMHLFSPIPIGTSAIAGCRHEKYCDRDSSSHQADPIGRMALRRSSTEPVGRFSHGSSNVERGDVTPFSQPTTSVVVDHHFATPQNTKSGQDFDAYLKHSQGAHRGVIENLRRIRQNTIDAMERYREEQQQHAASLAGNGTQPDLMSGGLPAVSGSSLMDSMPSCMPIPLHRAHSMPVFDGDMSSAHDNNNNNLNSGGMQHSLASNSNPNTHNNTRISYQGAWRQNQCHGGTEVGLLQRVNNNSCDNFQIRCAVSSPPQSRSGQSNCSSFQAEMRRESSDNSFGFGMYCNAHDGRESLAHSMIGTPPHHEADVSMLDPIGHYHQASNVHHRASGAHHQLLHQQLAADSPQDQLPPVNLQLNRDSGEYKQRLKKIKAKAKLRRMSCMVKPSVSSQLLFDNSDTSLNMSVDEVIMHSGRLGTDHSGMLSLSSISAQPFSSLQQQPQQQQQRSTQKSRRRVSMAFCAPPSLDDSIEHTQHNPIYVPGQPMANILEEHSFVEEEEGGADSFASGQFSNRKIVDGATVEYLLRRAVVTGGTFRQVWDNSIPVVVAPERNDKRVDDIRLGDGYELSIHVYNPREGSGKWMNLGHDWAWVNCNPIGYLLTKSTRITKNAKPQFYYVPKHPAHWNTFATMQLDTSGVQDMSEIEGAPGNYFVMDGVEDVLFPTISSPISLHTYSDSTAAVMKDFTGKKPLSLSSCLGTMRQKDIETVFSYLTDQDLYHSCLTLNKYWSLLVQLQYVPKVSDMLRRVQPEKCWERFRRFVMEYPRGKFLSDGAFKKVYCIQSCASKRRDALSIMDVKDLEEREIENVAKIEMEISMMCSILESMRICPNMIRVHAMFQAEHDIALWQPWHLESMSDFDNMPTLNTRNVTKRSFTDKKNANGRFQYCQMEFCTGGDVEERVRKCKVLSIDDVRSYLFQMLFAMYASRETLSLRHYDIKLLNFFATSLSNANAVPSPSSADSLEIGFGRHLYRIPCSENYPSIVKLADFGTSVVGSESLGAPITVQQFTTLENTPFEFLLLGDSARQSFASDTFCLGLSFLHLLTGFEPYEVLLKDVRCPALLKDRLNDVWSESNPSNPYHVIHMTIQSLQSQDLSEDDIDLSMISNDDSIHDILCDTLYRFLVLLGDAPSLEMGFVRNSLYEHNPVWKELVECLGLEEMIMQGRGFHSLPHTQPTAKRGNSNNSSSNQNTNNARGRQKVQLLLAQCRDTYRSHVQLFSIHSGQDSSMQRVRHRLSVLGEGSTELLEKLLHFDPAQRCTMYDALHHPVFESLRVLDALQDRQQQPKQPQRYVYYYNRNGYSSVDDGLPLL
jgi:serine/threonine protein kinase